MSQYAALVKKLKEIFQIDQADLDFGLYRILRSRSKEIAQYLEVDLKAKVESALQNASQADRGNQLGTLQDKIREEFGKRALDAQGYITDPALREDALVKQYLALLEAQPASGAQYFADEVFAHLATFFGRYYEKGDFISKRRYKGDTYAIPYSGEEVVLHWANKDQYYIKSGEQFTNFTFALSDARKVHFKLVSAETSKDNRKDSDKERRFVLVQDATVTRTDEDGEEVVETVPTLEEREGELFIHFAYQPMPKGTKQDDLNAQALETLLKDPAITARWPELFKRMGTEKNPMRTLLEKQLDSYTSRNSADYFIHKDLGGFLSRELDFYIKNEVMNLDDLQNIATFTSIEHRLRMIQVLRAVAQDLIAFLAQLENFQKKLWLKKKFVVEANYCITLDRVYSVSSPASLSSPAGGSPSLLHKVAQNDKQHHEWVKLGFVEEKDLPALKQWLQDIADGKKPLQDEGDKDLFGKTVEKKLSTLNSQFSTFLIVDTAFFDLDFKYELLAQIDNLDEQCDGLLIHSENFQALNLLQERYKEQVKCVYIDPPYNTGKDGFVYKDGYLHSTWNSMISDRIQLSATLIDTKGAFFSSIDENEFSSIRTIGDSVFGRDNLIAEFTWLTEGNFDNQAKVKIGHEYLISYAKDESAFPNPPAIDPSLPKNSKVFKSFIRNTIVKNGPKNPVSPISIPVGFPADFENGFIRADDCDWPKFTSDVEVVDAKVTKSVIASSGWSSKALCEKFIDSGYKSIPDSKGQMTRFVLTQNGAIESIKDRSTENGYVTSIIKSVGTVQSTSAMLFEMGANFTTFPKPVGMLSYIVSMVEDPIITLDFFAGSGTTGHAVINLNREDQGQRKYILVEMGEYFHTVTKPRIQKVVYSKDWKDGKATAPQTGVSHCFKYFQLESYEDTLNNLELVRTQEQQHALDLNATLRSDYLLHYMMDLESRHLLSTEAFRKPFDYKLKITTDSSGASSERRIDLVETFNYLIGLVVQKITPRLAKGYLLVEGRTLAGERVLVLWRDCDIVGYEQLLDITQKLDINPKDFEYDVLYVNGDHTIPNMSTTSESEGSLTLSLKLRQIEDEFLERMFAVEGV